MLIYNYEEFITDSITDDSIEVHKTTNKGYNYFEMQNTKTEPELPDYFFLNNNICIYCNKKTMQCVHHSDNLDKNNSGNTARIYVCRECGWWQYIWDELEIMGFSEFYIQTKRKAILKRFDTSKYETPLQIINEEAIKNPKVLYHLHPKKFEELVQWVFKAFYNCDVQHVGKSHDGGIDLIIIDSDNPVAVQVKRRQQPESVEPVSQVREFLGAMVHKDYQRGIFVTTANRFSKDANQLTIDVLKKRNLLLFDLINHDKFVSIFNIINKDFLYPWERIQLRKYKNINTDTKVDWIRP